MGESKAFSRREWRELRRLNWPEATANDGRTSECRVTRPDPRHIGRPSIGCGPLGLPASVLQRPWCRRQAHRCNILRFVLVNSPQLSTLLVCTQSKEVPVRPRHFLDLHTLFETNDVGRADRGGKPLGLA